MFKTHSPSKATFFDNLDGLSVAYINHEGVELPLKSVKDFDEAIKSAKWKGGDHLDLIFYDDRLNANEMNLLNNNKTAIIGRFSKKQTISIPSKSTTNNCCHCNGDTLPEWFKQYMKKFKKELLKDIKSTITDAVHEEFEREKKLTETKQFKPFSDKNEFQSPAKLKKKKKISDKDTIDLLEKREMKLLKKIEKLHSAKFDKLIYPVLYLEKLENKARTLLEERRKLLERGRQNKSRDAKRVWEPEKKHMKMEKSILFHEDSAFLTVQPGEDFSVMVNILNNGTLPWTSPYLECREKPEFYLKEHFITLPRLEPGQSIDVTIRGRVNKKVGSHHFAYKLFDGLEESDFVYSCFFVVSDTKEDIITNSKESIDSKTAPSENLVGSFIDFEKDMIANRQKKIKENIIEIERRLQDIDLLRPCTSGEKKSREARLNDRVGKFEAAGCDLQQGKEKNSLKNRLEQELHIGADQLKENEETEKNNPKDSSIESENRQINKSGLESDSDSELSVISMSEEDENFIVVPSVPKNSYPEGILLPTRPSLLKKMQCTENGEKTNGGIVEEHPVKIELGDEVGSEEVSTAEDCLPNQSANTKLIDKEERLKETKSKAEAEFASSNAALEGVTSDNNVFENMSFRNVDASDGNSKFYVESNGSSVFSHSKEGTSKKTEPGEKKNHGQNAFSFVFSHDQEFLSQQDKRKNSARKDKIFPLADTLGRPIYAVRIDGYCLPIKDLIDSRLRMEAPDAETAKPKDTQNGKKGDASSNYKPSGTEIPSVNIIPNVLVNGASSVASMAFNTAKSVINNLQSALKPETGFTPRNVKKYRPDGESQNSFPPNFYSVGPEDRSYVENLENQKKYFDAMITLQEMGFVNNKLNLRLLKKYDNEVTYVINEILDMMATPQNAEYF